MHHRIHQPWFDEESKMTWKNVRRMECIFQCHSITNSIFVLTGNLNHLNTYELQTNLGLEQIVNFPMHNDNILDQFITNRPDQFVVQVAQRL